MTTNITPEPEQRPNTRSRWIPRLRLPILAVGIGGALAGGLITAAVISGTGVAGPPAPAGYSTTGSAAVTAPLDPNAVETAASPGQPLAAPCAPRHAPHARRAARPAPPAPQQGGPAAPAPGQPAPPPPPPGR